MPTNVSPEYKKAQEQYRKAREPSERLRWLREMLSTIPKHKGTEHLQADIKTRIKQLTDDLGGPRKGASRTGPAQVVRPEGAAQIALLGPPNSGKSSLHKILTGSRAEVGPYPHTTQTLLPGMLSHENVPLQLIDLPPISADFMEPWLANALQPAHAAVLVIDLHEPGCAAHVTAIRERLDAKRISLVDDWRGRLPAGLVPLDWSSDPAAPALSALGVGADTDDEALADPFRVHLPTLLVINKADLGVDPEEVTVLLELTDARFPVWTVSAQSGVGLDRLGALLVEGLGVLRIYTKVPGRPPDKARPYTLFAGDTVEDLARAIHRDLAESLQFARVWGSAKFDGQQVGREHALRDGDIVELHT
jgi:ribosome-interacting GTPase 1